MTVEIVDNSIRKRLIEKNSGKVILAVLLVVSAAVFYFVALQQRYAVVDDLTGIHQADFIRFTSIVFTCVFVLTFLFQMGELRRLPLFYSVTAALLTGLVILGKISLLDYQSNDYEIFLSSWIYEYTLLPFGKTFGTYIGSDYSPPYLYFLSFISRLTVFPWLYLLKAISVAFDAFLAFGIMKLIGLEYDKPITRLGAFFLTMLLPTVVFNGAYWGQCDVIYSSICIMAIYQALKKRDIVSCLLFGIALSYKLQTVFFLPVLLPLWLKRKIRLRWLILIPCGYMLMMIPALLGGKSMHHVLTVYFQQANQYNFITMNGPNIYELFLTPTGDTSMLYNLFSKMALYLSFGFLFSVCLILCIYRRQLNNEAMLLSSLLFLSGIPLFLPKMHERYSFGADVMAFAVCFWNTRRRFLLPICFGFSSYILYTAGMAGDAILASKWSTVFYTAGIVLTFVELIRVLRDNQTADLMMDI